VWLDVQGGIEVDLPAFLGCDHPLMVYKQLIDNNDIINGL
jgi:hypothetical protein